MGLTSDALRPWLDAGRGRRSGVEEDAARPRVNSEERTQGELLREGERPACSAAIGRRVVKLRPRRAPTTANLSLRGGRRESEAQSLRSDPWAAVRRAKARSYAACPGFGGRESSRFLGRETLEKPDNGIIISEQPCYCPVFRDLSAQSVHFSSTKP